MSFLNLNLSSDVASKLKNNSALKSSVTQLTDEVQQLFARRLDALISDFSQSESATEASGNTNSATANTATATANAATTTNLGASANNMSSSSTSSFLAVSAAGSTGVSSSASVKAVEISPTTGLWQAPWMKGAENASSLIYKTYEESEANFDKKPGLNEFMQATGADFTTASNMLYGVVGSNKEMRNWDAIMKSDDPLTAARQATGAMYSSANTEMTSKPEAQVNPLTQKAKTENFSWEKDGQTDRLFLTDKMGNKLTQVQMTAPDMLTKMQNFGVDPTQLNQLADQLEASGVKYKPYQLFKNSDAGLDLRAIASGNAMQSMAYNWTADKNVEMKGEAGAARMQSNLDLARGLGLV